MIKKISIIIVQHSWLRSTFVTWLVFTCTYPIPSTNHPCHHDTLHVRLMQKWRHRYRIISNEPCLTLPFMVGANKRKLDRATPPPSKSKGKKKGILASILLPSSLGPQRFLFSLYSCNPACFQVKSKIIVQGKNCIDFLTVLLYEDEVLVRRSTSNLESQYTPTNLSWYGTNAIHSIVYWGMGGPLLLIILPRDKYE